MYVFSNSPRKYACKACHNKMGTDDLEAIFHEQLKQFFLSSETVTKYLGQADQILKEKTELLSSLETEQQKVKAQMDRIMQLYLADEITKEGFGREYKPLEERRKQLEDQIPVLQGEIDFVKIKFQSSDEVLAEAKDLYARWPTLSREEKHNIIEQITEKIIVGKGDVSIDLCYLPGSSEIAVKGHRNVRGSWPPPE
jgi:site-specific DNA recombinase